MKRIFSSPNLIEVTQLKDTLESARIACFIRNEISSGLSGGIPMSETTPELWIQDDHDIVEAMQIKKDWQASPKVIGSNWVCPACGETSEPQFTSCWKCGTAKL
jgi:putative signal transducing protein